jgi:Arc/MetJ-type ribon-helix-helix transcriptional regulator
MIPSKKSGLYVASKIPENLKLTIEEAVTTGSYLNKSEFVRDAIKEKLSKEGFLEKLGIKKAV